MKKSWIEIRKDLYRHIREIVDEKTGGVPKEIRAYQRSFEREFKKPWTPVSRSYFFKKLRQAEVVFLADFHALKQSQRVHLRLIRKFGSEKPILLLECFSSIQQSILDKFSAGKISERKFFEAIEWEKNWSFPWAHYRPLILWAVQNKLILGGLNLAGERSLIKRDLHSAEVISYWKKKFPYRKIFVQVGDLHLSRPKLPKFLVHSGLIQKENTVVVHQNSEDLYFQLLEKGIENQTEIIRLDPQIFCVMSVPPWVKWQNYLFFIEKEYENALLGRSVREAPDFTDHVAQLVKFISRELGGEVSNSELSVFSAEDENFWKSISKSVSSKQLLIFQRFVEEGVSFYIPKTGCGFLASPSVNHSAHLASLYIQHQLSGELDISFEFPKHFHQLIFREGLTYFGTKLVNHSRKTDTLFDMRTALSMSKSREITKESLLLALSQKTRELVMMSGRRAKKPSYRPRKTYSFYIASKLLGGLLGEKLYLAYRKGIVRREELRNLYSTRIFDDNFENVYLELLKKIDSISLHFKSKTERL